MMVRLFGWSAREVYEFYNLRHLEEGWTLPPPPNPSGLQSFLMACAEVTIEQKNIENGGAAKPKRQADTQREQRPRRQQ